MSLLRHLLSPLVVLVALGTGLLRRRRRRTTQKAPRVASTREWTRHPVGLVAGREIHQRLRSRSFTISLLITMIAVAAIIVIPTLHHSSAPRVRLGVTSSAPSSTAALAAKDARSLGVTVSVTSFASPTALETALHQHTIDLAVLPSRELLSLSGLGAPGSTGDTFENALALSLGQASALSAAHLSPSQISTLQSARPFTTVTLHPSTPRRAVDPLLLVGIIVMFMMINQYAQWILMGVMEEKSSRVVEVLLSGLRPVEMIGGKVSGIGLVALLQGGLTIASALIASYAVGSTLVHAHASWTLAALLLWFLLGYVFYSWVFAAVGSMVERIDQAQSLVLPFSLPLFAGYIYSLIQATSTSVSGVLRVLAYFPPTALFAMPTLVGRGDVGVLGFSVSVLIDLVTTVVVARLAAGIYRRAILHTGSRVRWRDVVATRTQP